MSCPHNDWSLVPLWLGYFPRNSYVKPPASKQNIDRGKAASLTDFEKEKRQTLKGTAARLTGFEKEKGTKMYFDLGGDYVCEPIRQFIPRPTE